MVDGHELVGRGAARGATVRPTGALLIEFHVAVDFTANGLDELVEGRMVGVDEPPAWYPSDKQAFSPADVTMMEGCPPASLKSSSAHHRVVGVAVASE